MRQDDQRRFHSMYSDNGTQPDRRFGIFLECDVPGASKLVDEILSDLDKTEYGIPWMRGLDVHKRILVSDYLYQCAYSVETNLVEAKLHLLEWLGARERDNARIADAVSYNGMDFNIKMPPAVAPIDELHSKLTDLHVAGFFRAIGSSLDCLSSLIAGVLGLPTNLRLCGVGSMERALRNIPETAHDLQTKFSMSYESCKNDSGPNDWLNWTNLLRNMLVHRGRRMIYHGLVQRSNPLLDQHGNTILRCDATMHLPTCPDRTDVEAWIQGPESVLSEDAEQTLRGVFKSSLQFERKICLELVDIWIFRRSNPDLIHQPDEQWTDRINESSFNGYAPSASIVNGEAIILNPIVKERMISAAVIDQQRDLWNKSPYVNDQGVENSQPS